MWMIFELSLRRSRGMKFPSRVLPSMERDFTPLETRDGFLTSIFKVLPRKTRVILKPGHCFGMHGSMRRPSASGRTPRIHWSAVWWLHEAVPESHGTRDLPALRLHVAYVVWQWTY